VLIDTDYRFGGPDGERTLGDLFDELALYHFMFGPDWDQGCEKCSFFAHHFDAIRIHLGQRDTTLAAVSNTSPANIRSYQQRMGWSFPWWSSLDTTFNVDFHTTFDPADIETGNAYYNYTRQHVWWTEAQGLSIFTKLDDGRIAHTYSTYGRGIEPFNPTYAILDLTPNGRAETYPFDWARRHDEY
jgi:predicted dithiol-disulfide oxidoreductase (DUF899 family)